MRNSEEDRNESRLALFIDFENLALGVKDTRSPHFDVVLVLDRLVEIGKIVVKRAYADWTAYKEYKRPFHEAGIELTDVPRSSYSGKNSADVRMVVDAMDLCYAKQHIDTFALASGDSDFSPLVSKLKENNKWVVGLGVKNSSSHLLIDNCDEFIYYEDLIRSQPQVQKGRLKKLPAKQKEAFERLLKAVRALQRQDREIILSSMVKQTIRRKHPEFNEEYYGYNAFSRLLEDAAKHDIVKLEEHSKSGGYLVLPSD